MFGIIFLILYCVYRIFLCKNVKNNLWIMFVQFCASHQLDMRFVVPCTLGNMSLFCTLSVPCGFANLDF